MGDGFLSSLPFSLLSGVRAYLPEETAVQGGRHLHGGRHITNLGLAAIVRVILDERAGSRVGAVVGLLLLCCWRSCKQLTPKKKIACELLRPGKLALSSTGCKTCANRSDSRIQYRNQLVVMCFSHVRVLVTPIRAAAGRLFVV